MRYDAPVRAAIAGGACAAAALTGASSALTALPPWAVFTTGAVLSIAATCAAPKRLNVAVSLAIGAAVGSMLPTRQPAPPGVVLTRAVASGMHGDLFEALDRLDEDPSSLLGRRISVSGVWSPADGARAATVSRRFMSCCAADEVDVGFDVTLEREPRVASGSWVRADGIVAERVVDGDVRYLLEHCSLRGLEDTAGKAH